jgi:hypothetical protein
MNQMNENNENERMNLMSRIHKTSDKKKSG